MAKESGWKLCVNWPIGGWKKYSLYTIYAGLSGTKYCCISATLTNVILEMHTML